MNYPLQRSCHTDNVSDVTSSFPVNLSVSYQHNAHYELVKQMYIYRVLMDRESDNMGAVPSLYMPKEIGIDGVRVMYM